MLTGDWTAEMVLEALTNSVYTEIGYLVLGAGRAVLPGASTGDPVEVSPEVAVKAVQQYNGYCWVEELTGILVDDVPWEEE